MKSFKIFIFMQIVAISHASKPRSVNLALETILEFNNDDDIKFIDTMQNYLDKIKSTIAGSRTSNRPIHKLREDVQDNEKQLKFSDFLANTVSVLKSYSDEALTRFFRVLNVELAKLNKNKSLDTDRLGFRRIITTNLQDLKNLPADDIRRKLNAITKQLHNDKRNGESGVIADFLNYFYRKESQIKLSRFINNLKLYRTSSRRSMNLDLEEIIRNAIRYIVEPIVKFNSNTDVKKLNKENIAHEIDSQQNNLKMMKNIKKEIEKLPKIIGERNKLVRKDTKVKQILNYIEELNKLVDNHIRTIETGIGEDNSKTNNDKSSDNIKKYAQTTREQEYSKPKPVHSSSEEVSIEKPRKKKYKKKMATLDSENNHHKIKVKKYHDKEDEEHGAVITDLSESKFPFVSIKLESHSKSDEDVSYKTTKQRRYKKLRRLTTKRYQNVHIRTPRQGRKAFKTSVASDDGLSIEHFGSLYSTRNIEIYRKSNNNDTFKQGLINTTLSDKTEKYLSKITLKEVMRDNFKEQTKNYDFKGHNEMKTNERKMTVINDEELKEDTNIISENVKLTGDIFFETSAKEDKVIKTTEGGTNENFRNNDVTKTYANFNGTSLTTQQLSFGEMKPTIVFRSQDFNKTDSSYKVSADPKVVTKTENSQTKNSNDGENTHTTKIDDYLENEIENKFNTSSTISGHLNNLNNKKLQSEMKVDLEKRSPSDTKIPAKTLSDLFKDIEDDMSD